MTRFGYCNQPAGVWLEIFLDLLIKTPPIVFTTSKDPEDNG